MRFHGLLVVLIAFNSFAEEKLVAPYVQDKADVRALVTNRKNADNLFYFPDENAIYTKASLKSIYMKEFIVYERFIGSSTFAGTETIVESEITQNTLNGEISFGAGPEFEVGIRQSLAVTGNYQDLDNSFDYTQTGLYDPEVFGRYRFIERDAGDSITDVFVTISPGIFNAEREEGIITFSGGNVARGGNLLGIGIQSGHKNKNGAALLGFVYKTTTGTTTFARLNDTNIISEPQSHFEMYVRTQYFIDDTMNLTFNLGFESIGEETREFDNQIQVVDNYGRLNLGLGANISFFNRTTLLRGLAEYRFEGSRSSEFLQSTTYANFSNKGREGLALTLGLEFVL